MAARRVARILVSAWGRREIQSTHNSRDSLGSCIFMIELAFSTLPEDWGQYGMWSFHWMFKVLATSCVI